MAATFRCRIPLGVVLEVENRLAERAHEPDSLSGVAETAAVLTGDADSADRRASAESLPVLHDDDVLLRIERDRVALEREAHRYAGIEHHAGQIQWSLTDLLHG